MRLPHRILLAVLVLSVCQLSAARKKDGNGGFYSYSGPRVDLSAPSTEHHSYDVEIMPVEGIGRYDKHAGQGFACWGDTGFMFYDGGWCKSIDLLSRKVIASFRLPSPVSNVSNHAGQACFGSEYASEGDRYPVLYLSSYIENCCFALRMTEESAELVQTIRITDGVRDDDSQELRLVNAQAFFPDGEKLIVKMGAAGHDGNKYKYWRVYEMPTLSMGEEVFIDEDKTSDEFFLRTVKGLRDGVKGNFYNAGFAKDGKIYILAGFSGANSRLLVIDYKTHEILNDIHWEEDAILRYEQEQCYFWGDRILINFNGKDQLACITFKD